MKAIALREFAGLCEDDPELHAWTGIGTLRDTQVMRRIVFKTALTALNTHL